MSINVDDFEIDPNPKYCPVCEELVIMRKGKRSCKCTRVYGLDPTGMRCFDWVDRDEVYSEERVLDCNDDQVAISCVGKLPDVEFPVNVELEVIEFDVPRDVIEGDEDAEG